ncbi:hypothetical protein ACMFMG_011102 [Clarireedia jacksonii]
MPREKEEATNWGEQPRRSTRKAGRNARPSRSEHKNCNVDEARRDLSPAQLKYLAGRIKDTPLDQDIDWNDIGRGVLKVLEPDTRSKVKRLAPGKTRSKPRYSAASMQSTAKQECSGVYNDWYNKKAEWRQNQKLKEDSEEDMPPRKRNTPGARRDRTEHSPNRRDGQSNSSPEAVGSLVLRTKGERDNKDKVRYGML